MDVAGDDEVDFTHTLAEDPNAFPQYVVKVSPEAGCSWMKFDWEKNTEIPCEVDKRSVLRRWTELDRSKGKLQPGIISSMAPQPQPLPTWSVYGHIMLSEAEEGLHVWGGREMQLLYTIQENVKAFMVSPNENYIVVQTEKDVSVMNLRTAKKIRTLGNLDLASDDAWPLVRFSADDSLVAVCKAGYFRENPTAITAGKMSIYLSETMELVQGSRDVPRSYTFESLGLYKAEWNPQRGTQIAYVCSLGKNMGWRVNISEITVGEDNVAREEVQCHRMFANAEELEILWHPAGTYLAVKVKTKKGTEYSLFHLARDVAAFQLAIKQNYTAGRFAWQPAGDMFAILLNDDTGIQLGEKSLLQVFAIKDRKKLKLIAEFPTSTNRLFWAPKGRSLCATNDDKSLLSFITINEHDKATERKTTCPMSNVKWDPTGRFFATWITSFSKGSNAGYRIYAFDGELCFEKKTPTFSHLTWRPLPPSLLTEAEVKQQRDPQNVKKLTQDYEEKEKALERERLEKEFREIKACEVAYVKKMNELARSAQSLHLEEKREQQNENSRWAKFWTKRIADLPESERVIHETIVEEREISCRQLS
ncbi:translation initiation factor 3 subunit B [Angomonas deanei]|uniref:Eukaryotic translation initiation factor eIF2A, putative n=1 Tax=Angomonas deanei TaxID=59799 RepID=A0A7G2CP32_9TRYP|nr:translation initiation factor 3 subunit B [Angomonas deanei]CAD2221616.1 Eukaryotic translation initiation factor eIF2A, putative [Angomonas deanei]|eukprot:EPY32159.1 translation initiation factor 3 subunit B [Angomonas deanei]